MAEKTLSQGLHTNSFLSALLNVLDPEMAASLAPQLDNQTIPHKFDVIVAGIRQRLKVADVMLNQLEISSHPTITQRVLFAAQAIWMERAVELPVMMMLRIRTQGSV